MTLPELVEGNVAPIYGASKTVWCMFPEPVEGNCACRSFRKLDNDAISYYYILDFSIF